MSVIFIVVGRTCNAIQYIERYTNKDHLKRHPEGRHLNLLKVILLARKRINDQSHDRRGVVFQQNLISNLKMNIHFHTVHYNVVMTKFTLVIKFMHLK